MLSERRVKLKTLNDIITCALCEGYLIDATTITECLHTFCKSCLLKYLVAKKTCPTCDNLIHQSHPLQYICIDRTMQDVINKLVPNLETHERQRIEKFYSERGVKLEDVMPEVLDQAKSELNIPTVPADTSGDCHRSDEQINLCVMSDNAENMEQINRRYIRCSAHATVTHLKKYLCNVLSMTQGEVFREIEILCNKEPMGKDHSLNFILKTRWRTKITYRTSYARFDYNIRSARL